MSDFTIGQNDRAPYLAVTCTGADGLPQDLTGATVVFTMKLVGGAIKVNETAAVITDAVNGVCEYRWAAGDTDTTGNYLGEFEVTLGGRPITFPNGDSKISIEVAAELA